ncbi:SET domain-containing protein [Stipitochalara longipes BDJ]|nr:SET domain-containing protein [Stipitochalara longipes BDJ]
MAPTEATTPPSTPTLQPENLDITISLSPPIRHDATPPATPERHPESLSPIPLRYPDTLGTLIEIRDTEAKGLGVFALHDIEPGNVLLCETPIVTLIDTGSRADPLDIAVNALSPTQKASFLSLHHFSRNKNESVSRSIVYSNGYSINNDLATGVFETASRINHSCVPNSHYLWKESIGRMVFWNRFKLLEGEEVTVDYGHKKKYLEKIYGFECQCGGCTDSGSDVRSSSGSESGGIEDMRSLNAVIHESLEEEKGAI